MCHCCRCPCVQARARKQPMSSTAAEAFATEQARRQEVLRELEAVVAVPASLKASLSLLTLRRRTAAEASANMSFTSSDTNYQQ
jgi:hypothetical protein